jgi:hypothetical protein
MALSTSSHSSYLPTYLPTHAVAVPVPVTGPPLPSCLRLPASAIAYHGLPNTHHSHHRAEQSKTGQSIAHSPQPTAHSPQPTAHSPQPTIAILPPRALHAARPREETARASRACCAVPCRAVRACVRPCAVCLCAVCCVCVRVWVRVWV